MVVDGMTRVPEMTLILKNMILYYGIQPLNMALVRKKNVDILLSQVQSRSFSRGSLLRKMWFETLRCTIYSGSTTL